jgi:OOP family OmpA-OmpF porin
MRARQQRIRPSTGALAGALALAAVPAFAQEAWPGTGLRPAPGQRSMALGCGASLLPCSERTALSSLQQPRSLRWSVELSPVNIPAATRAAWANGRQGLSLSVMGRQPLFGSGFSLYGRLGTAASSSFGDTATMGGPGETSYGVAFGAGVSMDFTQRLSATFGIDSYDLRAAGNGPVRSTSLGLQYRY